MRAHLHTTYNKVVRQAFQTSNCSKGQFSQLCCRPKFVEEEWGRITEKTPEHFSWIYFLKSFPVQIFFAVILVICSGLNQNLRKYGVSAHCYTTFVEASFEYIEFAVFLRKNIGSFLLTPPSPTNLNPPPTHRPTHTHTHTHTHIDGYAKCEIINLKFSLLQVGMGGGVLLTEQKISNKFIFIVNYEL